MKFLPEIPDKNLTISEPFEYLVNTLQESINILTLEESDYEKRIIWLFWDWWSGKSSIIANLKQNNTDLEIIEYDTWSHKEDFLKRAFLVYLIQKLFDEKLKLRELWYNDNWDNRNKDSEDNKDNDDVYAIDYLLKKFVKKKLYYSMKIKMWIVLVIIAVILYLKIFDIKLYYIWKYLYWFLNSYAPVIASYLYQYWEFVYIFIVLLLLISAFYRGEIGNLLNYIFWKRLDYTEVVFWAEHWDFSTYDYQVYFNRLISKWVQENKDKKLIIVLDNLDRVSDEQILSFISLLQITFDGIKNKVWVDNSDFSKKLVFVVPIDKSNLIRVLQNLISDEGKTKENKKFWKWFIDKLFSVVIDIPKLEQTKWGDYFNEKFEEVFEWVEVNKNDIDEIKRIFYSSIKKQSYDLTPREIVNFINELLAEYIFWKEYEERYKQKNIEAWKTKDWFDIKNLAYFVAIKRYWKRKQDLDEYIQQIIKRAQRGENEEIYLIEFYYKTKDIWNIVYENKFYDALIKWECKEVKNIIDVFKKKWLYESHFKMLLESIKNRINEKMKFSELANMAYCIGEFRNDLESLQPVVCKYLWKSTPSDMVDLNKKTARWIVYCKEYIDNMDNFTDKIMDILIGEK